MIFMSLPSFPGAPAHNYSFLRPVQYNLSAYGRQASQWVGVLEGIFQEIDIHKPVKCSLNGDPLVIPGPFLKSLQLKEAASAKE